MQIFHVPSSSISTPAMTSLTKLFFPHSSLKFIKASSVGFEFSWFCSFFFAFFISPSALMTERKKTKSRNNLISRYLMLPIHIVIRKSLSSTRQSASGELHWSVTVSKSNLQSRCGRVALSWKLRSSLTSISQRKECENCNNTSYCFWHDLARSDSTTCPVAGSRRTPKTKMCIFARLNKLVSSSLAAEWRHRWRIVCDLSTAYRIIHISCNSFQCCRPRWE